MSIINKPPEMVKRQYHLQESVPQAVEKYAIFIQSPPDQVVNSPSKMLGWGHAEFRRCCQQQQTKQTDTKLAHHSSPFSHQDQGSSFRLTHWTYA